MTMPYPRRDLDPGDKVVAGLLIRMAVMGTMVVVGFLSECSGPEVAPVYSVPSGR